MISHDVEYEDEDESPWGKLREIGNHAVWSVSTCKVGFGVEQLRDGSLDSYWQCVDQNMHVETYFLSLYFQIRRNTTSSGEYSIPAQNGCAGQWTRSRGNARVGQLSFLLKNVCIYTDFRIDESYTPSKISVRVGSHFHDLEVTSDFFI